MTTNKALDPDVISARLTTSTECFLETKKAETTNRTGQTNG